MKKQGHSNVQNAWVQGVSGQVTKPMVHITQFELQCATLSIDSYDYAAILASPEMLQWIQSNKNDRYIPSSLLRALGAHGKTIWDDTSEPRRLPRESKEDQQVVLQESTAVLCISTR
jgi:hypothetical protein